MDHQQLEKSSNKSPQVKRVTTEARLSNYGRQSPVN
jgi:hypothetical protein